MSSTDVTSNTTSQFLFLSWLTDLDEKDWPWFKGLILIQRQLTLGNLMRDRVDAYGFSSAHSYHLELSWPEPILSPSLIHVLTFLFLPKPLSFSLGKVSMNLPKDAVDLCVMASALPSWSLDGAVVGVRPTPRTEWHTENSTHYFTLCHRWSCWRTEI